MSLRDNSTRSIQIVSGSSLTTFTSPNVFTYRLPANGFTSGKDEIALKLLTMYFSWPNISAAAGNNSYSYHWPNTSQGEFPVVMPDGIFSYDDFNDYFQQVMKSNGHYLIDDNNNEVYYMSITVNGPLYCLSLLITPIPASLPSGWTNPGSIAFNGSLQYPSLHIPAGLSKFTGFTAGWLTSKVTSGVYKLNSGIPQATSVQTLFIKCNLVDNTGFSLTPNYLTSFVVPSGTASGGLIRSESTVLEWAPIGNDTNYQQIEISIVDQSGNPLNIRDPSGFVAVLSVRRRQ